MGISVALDAEQSHRQPAIDLHCQSFDGILQSKRGRTTAGIVQHDTVLHDRFESSFGT